MDLSPRLSLSYVLPQQAQKHVTINETFRRLDALVQLSVLSRTAVNEPATPAEGDAYILPAGKTGASWSSFADQSVASFRDGVWSEIAAVGGFIAYVADEDSFYRFAGGNWGAFSGASSGNSTLLGVNTIADATNRLAVKSDAVLFNHDDVTPGTGDHRLTINKSATAKTASAIFQTGASSRAEFGLTGDDDFHVKVSTDGSTWTNAVTIDNASGFVGVLSGGDAKFPVSINAGATGAVTINGRSINPAGVYAETTSGRSGFVFSNTNNYLPSGASNPNSTFAFQYPFDSGGDQTYRVFRISQGATLADNFWINLGGGIVSGAPTGGDKGAGAINAEAVYDDNSLLFCYVFDQALDGAIDQTKWDGLVPDRRAPDLYDVKILPNGGTVIDPKTEKPVFEKIANGAVIEARTHEPAKKFAARAGKRYDPLTLDGYAAHWKDKRHLSSMPNEAAFDPVNGQLTTGEWIQRLLETVEIQAVLIEQLNARLKTLEGA